MTEFTFDKPLTAKANAFKIFTLKFFFFTLSPKEKEEFQSCFLPSGRPGQGWGSKTALKLVSQIHFKCVCPTLTATIH
jgi:hypothetical protein